MYINILHGMVLVGIYNIFELCVFVMAFDIVKFSSNSEQVCPLPDLDFTQFHI